MEKTELVLQRICADGRLSKLAVSETGFIFDPQTGQSYTLNHTGMLALDLIKRGNTLENAAQYLADEYEVSREIAASSLEAFLFQLGRYL
ncbi:MAG: PqqD family protein [Candidatus Obscuribacterales bacterium]|nr:PqqD family protein [Candidatus Obscuribacterales bacterium]